MVQNFMSFLLENLLVKDMTFWNIFISKQQIIIKFLLKFYSYMKRLSRFFKEIFYFYEKFNSLEILEKYFIE